MASAMWVPASELLASPKESWEVLLDELLAFQKQGDVKAAEEVGQLHPHADHVLVKRVLVETDHAVR